MPIVAAREVDFSSSPRCPECGISVLPYGRNEPLVVDAQGRVYCREHGAAKEPDYSVRIEAYRALRKSERLAAIQGLEEVESGREIDAP